MEKGRVEVARSFSFKLNLGNYENVDFFCSEKSEVDAKDAEKTSEALYQFCKEQVIKDVNAYKRELDAIKNAGARKFERKDNAKQSAEFDAGRMALGMNDFGDTRNE